MRQFCGVRDDQRARNVLLTYFAFIVAAVPNGGCESTVRMTPQHRRDLAGEKNATFSPDGTHVAALCPNGMIVWDAASGDKRLAINTASMYRFCQAAYTPDGRHLVTVSELNTLTVWDASTGGELLAVGPHHSMEVQGRVPTRHEHEILKDSVGWTRRLILCTHGKRAYVVSYRPTQPSGPGEVTCWDLETGTKLFDLDTGAKSRSSQQATPPEDPRRRSTTVGRRPLLDVARNRRISYGLLELSPDGKLLAAPVDRSIQLWDAQTGEESLSLPSKCSFRSIAFSPDSNYLASIADDNGFETILWDLASGQEAQRIAIPQLPGDHDYRVICFDTKGSHVAVAGSGSIRVWHVVSKALIHSFRSDSLIRDIRFSPQDEFLAAGCGNSNEIFGSRGDIMVWDLEAGELLHHFTGQQGYIQEISFSPRGRQLLSVSPVSVVLWDAAERPSDK